MDARSARGAAVLAVALVIFGTGAGYKTPNFVVMAPTPQLAEKIGRMAEQYRHTLAIAWTGKPMPDWSQPCPITAKVAPNLGAGGETSFVFDRNEVYGWTMKIQGTEERVLDSVLPHEVSHTIFASYFRQPMPRWADEGACTTVEHESERSKQHKMLDEFLRTDRGIPFAKMFVMKQYPKDILPLYAQGYSLSRYLIQQGGRHKFVAFLASGMRDEQWANAVREHYGYKSLGDLQDTWLKWVSSGSPKLASAGDDSIEGAPTDVNWPGRKNQETLVARNQSPDDTPASKSPYGNSQPNKSTSTGVSLAGYNAANGQQPAAPRELTPLVASDTPVLSLEQLAPASNAIQLPPVSDNRNTMTGYNAEPRTLEQPSAPQGPQTARGRSIYERNVRDDRGSQPLGQAPGVSVGANPTRGSLNPAAESSSTNRTPVMPAGFSPSASRNPAVSTSEGQQKVLVQWGEPSEALDVKW